jgi:hypothetical protein
LAVLVRRLRGQRKQFASGATSQEGRLLRHTVRKKDGKEHRYFSVVENKRVTGGRVVQRHVLYLGEINDTQEHAWRKSIEVFEEGAAEPQTLLLFPRGLLRGAFTGHIHRSLEAVAGSAVPTAGWC